MRPLELHALVRTMLPWGRDEPDNLKPEGETVFDVIDHWMACRADIFELGSMKQARYCLTDDDVRKLAEHIEKWLEGRA